MKLRFSKKEKLIGISGTLVIVLFIVIAQLYVLSPLRADLKMKQQSLKLEQKLLDVIIQKQDIETKKITEDTRELQKKVPVKPLQEQFILDLERAETVSNSQIKSMSFTKDAEVIPENGETGTENGTSNGPDATNNETSEQSTESAPSNGLKKLSVSLSVESSSYEDLEKFIKTLESLKRIVVVESINYTGGEEITSLAQEKQSIAFSLTISAYYLPTLDDLLAALPKIDAPAPANKHNPLSTFADPTNAQ